ncbi:MAG TPA: hypothetical protein EYN06_01480 [Myxococcales bacterium]|nr:hypothetical protein [Myxococcales bacterium]
MSVILCAGCGDSDSGGGFSVVSGQYEISYKLDVNDKSCQNGQWSATLNVDCISCSNDFGKKKVPPTGARTFLWQFQDNLWTELDTLDLELGTDTPYSADLSALGVTCEAIATAVVIFPTGPGYYGAPDAITLVKGAAQGGGLAYDFETEKTKYVLYCNSKNVIRAEAIIYTFTSKKVAHTISLNAPIEGGTGLEATSWKGVGANTSSRHNLVVFFGYDGQDVIQCAHFL